jgi:hypothetical protein
MLYLYECVTSPADDVKVSVSLLDLWTSFAKDAHIIFRLGPVYTLIYCRTEIFKFNLQGSSAESPRWRPVAAGRERKDAQLEHQQSTDLRQWQNVSWTAIGIILMGPRESSKSIASRQGWILNSWRKKNTLRYGIKENRFLINAVQAMELDELTIKILCEMTWQARGISAIWFHLAWWNNH